MGLNVFLRGELPRWLPVRQQLVTESISDVDAAVASAWRAVAGETVAPGMRVALAVGSRGIDRLDSVVAAVVREVKRLGAEPFIVPAMGSHGGATAEGQTAMLATLGITESTVKAPIRASMETIQLGTVHPGEGDALPVFFDRLAATEADAVIPINRVKPHTDFEARIESGLIKMLVIGLGKQAGADTMHRWGDMHFGTLLPLAAQCTLEQMPIPFGIALVENGLSHLAHIEAVRGRDLIQREPELLALAREYMPRLPGTALDVLIVDYLGKDISGTGVDPNVVNRYYGGPLPQKPTIQRIIVRNLTEATAGNASGIGLCDIALRQAVEQIDPVATYMNCITSKKPSEARVPLTVDNDRMAVYVAIASCLRVQSESVRLARITDTKHLDTLWVSEPLWHKQLDGLPGLTAIGPSEPIRFGEDGMFV